MVSTNTEPTGQRPTDFSGSTIEHHIGAAGEHLVASLFLAEGVPVYWPALTGWVDMVVQTPHGFKRVQVKTSATHDDKAVRVRSLGSDGGIEPSDRYDILAVVHKHRVWLIPAAVIDGKQTITLHPQDINCTYAGFRKR